MRKRSQGYTLLELIIAVGIMAILSSIVLANFHRANKSKSVQLGADTVVAAIRTAQENSLSPKQIAAFPSCTLGKIPTEYRLIFDTAQPAAFKMFVTDKCGDQPPVLLQAYILPPNVRIKNPGFLIDNTNANTPLEIKFQPPFARNTVRSNNTGAYRSFAQTAITLELNDGSVSKKIILDGISGRIDIQ